jgi:hypothetical protein
MANDIVDSIPIVTTISAETPTIAIPTAPPQQHDVDDEVIVTSRPHFRNRMLLCLVAIGFNWGTSLRVANHFAARVIEIPLLDLVLGSCRTAYNATIEEKARYSTCVESQLEQCDVWLDRSISREDQRVMLISRQNEDVLQRIVELATSCSEAYTTLRLALDGWTANGGEIPLQSTDDSLCSEEDQILFNQTLLGTQNIIALQTEAIGIADAYSEESAMAVQRLAAYAVERAEYDASYVDAKTQQIQDIVSNVINGVKVPSVSLDDLFNDLELSAIDLVACLSLDVNARKSDGSKCDPNVASMLDDFAKDAKWKLDILKEALYEYKERMEEYKRNVRRAYDVAKAFYIGKLSIR